MTACNICVALRARERGTTNLYDLLLCTAHTDSQVCRLSGLADDGLGRAVLLRCAQAWRSPSESARQALFTTGLHNQHESWRKLESTSAKLIRAQLESKPGGTQRLTHKECPRVKHRAKSRGRKRTTLLRRWARPWAHSSAIFFRPRLPKRFLKPHSQIGRNRSHGMKFTLLNIVSWRPPQRCWAASSSQKAQLNLKLLQPRPSHKLRRCLLLWLRQMRSRRRRMYPRHLWPNDDLRNCSPH